jgi:hypothetical protein
LELLDQRLVGPLPRPRVRRPRRLADRNGLRKAVQNCRAARGPRSRANRRRRQSGP